MRLIKHIIIVSIAFLITISICEVYIRFARISEVTSTEFCYGMGKVRRNNFDYFLINEGIGIGRINEFRYIGKPIPPGKDNNTIRIALLGDSFIEAYEVLERHYFGNIAENLLKTKFPGKKIEILNFGSAGFEITDMYIYQKNTVDKFNPDYIFYLISEDDLEPENSDSLRARLILKNDSLIISYAFDPDGVKKYNRSNFLLMNSSVLNMVNDCRKKLKTVSVGSILLDKVYLWFDNTKTNSGDSGSGKPGFIINPITSKIIESLDPEMAVIINRGDKKLPSEFINLCEKRGLKFFDLNPVLKQAKESGNDPQQWKVTKKHGHWNYYGHQLVGEEISDIISDLVNNSASNR